MQKQKTLSALVLVQQRELEQAHKLISIMANHSKFIDHVYFDAEQDAIMASFVGSRVDEIILQRNGNNLIPIDHSYACGGCFSYATKSFQWTRGRGDYTLSAIKQGDCCFICLDSKTPRKFLVVFQNPEQIQQVFVEAHTAWAPYLIGCIGATGPQGPQGSQGSIGFTGPQGLIGAWGFL